MKVIEHIQNSTQIQFSFEIIPPKRGTSVNEITDILSLVNLIIILILNT